MRTLKKNRRPLIIALTAAAMIIFGALFVLRHDIKDIYARWQRGPIPKALTREELTSAQRPPSPATYNLPPATSNKPPAKVTQPAPPVSSSLPSEINIQVPFVLQAPLGIWDATHEDACEEASLLMLKGFTWGEAGYTKEEMDRQIYEVIAFEEKRFGYSKDTSAVETAAVLSEFFGIKNVKVLTVSSWDDIKRQLAAGRPVIVPAYGKALKNPYFRQGGPLYHMLVIKGYTKTRVITHDPGTRRGENYLYTYDILWNAIHDWNGGDVPMGKKVMIVAE